MNFQPRYHNDPAGYYKPCQGATAYEDLSIDGTVKTPTPPAGARIAKIFFRGANVRVTFHGVNPSSTVGVPFYDGYEEWFTLGELQAMRMTREGSTNGEAHIIYYS